MKLFALLLLLAFSALLSAAEINECFDTGGGWNSVNPGTNFDRALIQAASARQYTAAANEEVYEVCWHTYFDMNGDQAEIGVYELQLPPPNPDEATYVNSVVLTATSTTEYQCNSSLNWALTDGETYAVAGVYYDYPSRVYVKYGGTDSGMRDSVTEIGGVDTLPSTWDDAANDISHTLSWCARTQAAAPSSAVPILMIMGEI